MQQWLLLFGIKILTVYIWWVILEKMYLLFIFSPSKIKVDKNSLFQKESCTCKLIQVNQKVHWGTKSRQYNEMIISLYRTLNIMPQIAKAPSGCAIASQVLTKFVWNIVNHERFVDPFLSIIQWHCHAAEAHGEISQISWCFSLLTKITMPFVGRNLKRIAWPKGPWGMWPISKKYFSNLKDRCVEHYL